VAETAPALNGIPFYSCTIKLFGRKKIRGVDFVNEKFVILDKKKPESGDSGK
jgi:hypothetical protein